MSGQNKSTGAFMQHFYSIWEDSFSYPVPTDAEIRSSDGDMIQARITAKRALHNASRPLLAFFTSFLKTNLAH